MLTAFLRGFQSPVLTRRRVWSAYAVAVTTDALQFLLGPFGWVLVDELLDIAAMIVIARLIGFHPVFLPTFVLEFIPVVEMLPTWTACVAIVVALRGRPHSTMSPPDGRGPIIDV